ncbi:DUF2182 domain-containing protein [Halioxenophilus sp. WMMB6]|uniref:DUF2182 domain-containing protein n=1 Tax=Halioxenophilus sp. WMMB6 TaxID=3073815 RepID=UPI00295EA5C2|nr:DUF2182 domain-containing protein [Halioxenophilus sp. WMMB6]
MFAEQLQQRTNREKWLLIIGLALMVTLAWWYLIDMALAMSSMDMQSMDMQSMDIGSMDSMEMSSMDMSSTSMSSMPGEALSANSSAMNSMVTAWGALDLLLLFLMWAVMMVAMMLPSASPMILTFLSVNQRRARSQRNVVPTYIFVSGYIVVWSGYSLLATLLQWQLHEHALIRSDMQVGVPYLVNTILIGAGVFQFTKLKQTCLQHCRSPLSFLMRDWREGYTGAFYMGLHHGAYCVGCCWILMLVLFVTGVMNLFAIALLSAFVLAEKLIPGGRWLSYLSGIIFIGFGLSSLALTV